MTMAASDSVPLVSVLMTAYNRENYIAEAIESVLASDYKNFELIVVDDASSDSTVEIVRRYADSHNCVRLEVNEKNLSDYPNRNQAASLASGKYLKYLDSDDAIYPYALSAMVDWMEQFPQAGLGLCTYAFKQHKHPVILSPTEAYMLDFSGHDLFGRAPGSSIIRTKEFWDAGGFSGLNQMGDLEMWLKLARSTHVLTMPGHLVWSRVHVSQEQNYDSVAEKAGLRARLRRGALHHPDCPLSGDELENGLTKLTREHTRQFWNLALRRRSLSDALSYKRQTGLSWKAVSYFFARPLPENET